jgi:hypothetical protein
MSPEGRDKAPSPHLPPQEAELLFNLLKLAKAETLLFVDHSVMAVSFRNEMSNLHWVSHVLAVAEPEVAQRAGVILSKIGQDMKAFEKYEGDLLDKLHDEAVQSPNTARSEVSKHGRELFVELEKRLGERTKEIEELLTEAMRLSGTRVEMPAHLIKPRGWKRLTDMVERVASGYAKERLEK